MGNEAKAKMKQPSDMSMPSNKETCFFLPICKNIQLIIKSRVVGPFEWWDVVLVVGLAKQTSRHNYIMVSLLSAGDEISID